MGGLVWYSDGHDTVALLRQMLPVSMLTEIDEKPILHSLVGELPPCLG